MSVSVAHSGWRIERFQLYALQRRLMRGCKIAKTEPKAIDVLIVLADRAGEVVSKDEITRKVWGLGPARDDNISTLIRSLRRILGESAIDTSHRSGYKLACKVECLDQTDEMNARRLISLFNEANDRRHGMTDKAWEELYLPFLPEVRESLDWSLASPTRSDVAIALAGMTGRIWERAKDLTSGRQYIERALALIDNCTCQHSEARLLYHVGLLYRESDRPRALSYFTQAAAIYRGLEDDYNLGVVLGVKGDAEVFLGQYDKARATLKEAENILSLSDKSKALLNVRNSLGNLAVLNGSLADAIGYFELARQLARDMNDRMREYLNVTNIAEAKFKSGDLRQAIQLAKEAARGLENSQITHSLPPLVNLAAYYALDGDLEEARLAATNAFPALAQLRGSWLLACLRVWCILIASDGRAAEAGCLAGFIEGQFEKTEQVRQPASQRLYERLMEMLKKSLAPQDLEMRLAEGAAWSETRAVKLVTGFLAPNDALSAE